MADRGRSTISQQDVQVTSQQITRRRRRKRVRSDRYEHLHLQYPDPVSQFPEIVAQFDPWRRRNRYNDLAPFYLHTQRNDNNGLWNAMPNPSNAAPPSQQLLQQSAMHNGITQFQNNIMQRMRETLDARYVANPFQCQNQRIMHGPSMVSNEEQILIHIRQQRIMQNYAMTHSVSPVLLNQYLGNGFGRNQHLGNGFNQNQYLGNGFNQNQYLGNVFNRNQHLGNGLERNQHLQNGFNIQQNQQMQLQTSVHSQLGNMGESRMIGNAFPEYQQVETIENPRVISRDNPQMENFNGTRSMENNWDPFLDIYGQARVATVIANCDYNSDHNHAYISPEQGQAPLEPPASPTNPDLSSLLQDLVPKDNVLEDEDSLVDESFLDSLVTVPAEWPDINIDQV
ncbi:hypothetical protein FRX31_030483 [Thalictrum thalictroides]|uniref:Uncharacterized protein n=1 Tax=Thalictrum thalictroides TaxID=46969 RepID=A0A7J6V4D3_THATH|nr:hypothetical protein FRX31_030483 [Thalictrum thalictroides]